MKKGVIIQLKDNSYWLVTNKGTLYDLDSEKEIDFIKALPVIISNNQIRITSIQENTFNLEGLLYNKVYTCKYQIIPTLTEVKLYGS